MSVTGRDTSATALVPTRPGADGRSGGSPKASHFPRYDSPAVPGNVVLHAAAAALTPVRRRRSIKPLIAQLVERPPCKRDVAGSIPARGTIIR